MPTDTLAPKTTTRIRNPEEFIFALLTNSPQLVDTCLEQPNPQAALVQKAQTLYGTYLSMLSSAFNDAQREGLDAQKKRIYPAAHTLDAMYDLAVRK